MKKFLLVSILFLAAQASAQDVVRGVIKNADGAPLTGATISIKNSVFSAVADANGEFKINAPQTTPFTLLVNFVSYKLQEVEVYEVTDEVLEITLVEDGLLNEVVVTSRRREETAQHVPIPISVVSGSV